MPTTPMNRVIQHLLAACGRDGMTDGELLTRFLSGRDDDALAALMRRHGPMVWGVCCRLLRSHHDAEDAFQATFLVLVRKAAALPNRETVGNWLYGVARQTAVRLRAVVAKRGVRERQVAVMPEPATAEQYVWNDLSPVVDEELSRLPDKYRVLIVLCDLEGVTRKEVARRLGIPEGTAASRLAAARAMLAKRLARRGIVVSGVLLGAVMSQQSACASVPTTIVTSTIKAASLYAAGQAATTGAISATVVALTEGVLKAMMMSKFMPGVVAVLAVVVLSVGWGAWSHGTAADPPTEGARPLGGKEAKKGDAKTQREGDIIISGNKIISNNKAESGYKWHDKPIEAVALPATEVKVNGEGPKDAISSGGTAATVRLDTDVMSIATKSVLYEAVPLTKEGKTTTGFRSVEATRTTLYRAKDIKAYDLRGKEIGGEELSKRLKVEVVAVVVPSGGRVDPLLKGLLKDDTLLLVLPPPEPTNLCDPEVIGALKSKSPSAPSAPLAQPPVPPVPLPARK